MPVYSLTGEVVDQIELSQAIFALPFNEAVVHQAMARQLANRRQGTAATKTRWEVSGSTRKLYAQKHTGRARRGDIKSPLLRGMNRPLAIVLLVLILLISLGVGSLGILPIPWNLLNSLKTPAELFQYPSPLFPSSPSLEAYGQLGDDARAGYPDIPRCHR